MTDEQGFLDALAAEPEDGLTRLAYADWLEERGDPRAELLRLEETPRASGPPSRLLALHGALDAEWVLRVSRSAPLAELRLLLLRQRSAAGVRALLREWQRASPVPKASTQQGVKGRR